VPACGRCVRGGRPGGGVPSPGLPPFGKSIPARDLFARQAHAEAIARISFCVVESALEVVTGDVGAGKTVALRAAVSTLDPTRDPCRVRVQCSELADKGGGAASIRQASTNAGSSA